MQTLHNVLAPAKLNLFLHITGRREDGYHLLQSVFMLIDWCDTLHFDTREDGQLSREDLTIPLPADDLVLRAAKALQSASGTTLGAHIAIDKTIPAQAGMGGGSSDAASTLLALNRLWGLNWPLSQLLPLGLALGADVPSFCAATTLGWKALASKSPLFLCPSAALWCSNPMQAWKPPEFFAIRGSNATPKLLQCRTSLFILTTSVETTCSQWLRRCAQRLTKPFNG